MEYDPPPGDEVLELNQGDGQDSSESHDSEGHPGDEVLELNQGDGQDYSESHVSEDHPGDEVLELNQGDGQDYSESHVSEGHPGDEVLELNQGDGQDYSESYDSEGHPGDEVLELNNGYREVGSESDNNGLCPEPVNVVLADHLQDVELQHASGLSHLSEVLPTAPQLSAFLASEISKMEPGAEATVPVQVLRWTHDTLNAQLAFGTDHEHADESIFKLFEQLFRGRLTPLDITTEDPLPVFLHRGPDNHLGLYSRRNRRLAAFLMYQALRREELLMVRVLAAGPALVQLFGFLFRAARQFPQVWGNHIGLRV